MSRRSKTYYEQIYKLDLTVFVDKDPEKAKKYCENIIGETLDDIDFNVQAKTIDYQPGNGGQKVIVWLRTPEISLMAHEFIHVVEYCFGKRDIPFNLEASENIAYYVENLFRTFEPLLKNKRRKKSSKVV